MILWFAGRAKKTNRFKDINALIRIVFPASLHNFDQVSLFSTAVLMVTSVDERPIPRRHFPLNDRVVFVFVKRPQPCELRGHEDGWRDESSLRKDFKKRAVMDDVRRILTRQ